MTSIQRFVVRVDCLVMLLQCDLCSAGELTPWLWTCHLDLIVVDTQVGLDVSHRLASVLAELTTKWFLCGVPVLDVTLQC